MSKYTTVKGKLFGELQEDKARLASLKDELKDAEESFEKAKEHFLKSLQGGVLGDLKLFNGDFDKSIENAVSKLKELSKEVNEFKDKLDEDELADYYKALNKGDDEAIKNLLAKKGESEDLLDTIKQELLLRDEVTNVLQKQNKEIRTSVGVESQAMRMRKQGWADIKRGATEAYKIGKDFLDVWGKIDQAASKFAKSVGTSAVGMQRLRKNAIESVQKGRYGAKYNVSADELIGLQETYSNTIGRNIQISASDQENMAAMFRVMGEGGGDFVQKLENFGLSYTDAANKVGKMFKEASKYGISFDKYSKNVANNIKLAQNYTFKNGVKGLESMAKKATAMRLDMQQVASFADKVSTVEGAINTGAQLQVLGGPFAQFADPMGMLNEGLTNMEGLQDRFEKMIGSLARFNERTGEVSVSAFNKQRIKVAAEAMGMSYDQVMETTMAKGRQNYVGQQIANKGYSKEEQGLLKNIATITEGKAMVSYVDENGRKRDVNLREQRLTTTQLEAIKKQTQSETDDIKDIATTLRGWDDVMQGTKKQYENTKAAAIERTRIGERTKGIVEHVAESNKLLGLILAAVTVYGGFGAIKDIFGGARSYFGGVGGKSGAAGKSASAGGDIFTNISGSLRRTGGKIASKPGARRVAGKAIGKIGKNIGKFGRVGTGLGIAGAAIGLGTDALVSSGNIKRGGFGDYAGHMAGDALSYGSLGLMLGGPIGAAIGAGIGLVSGAITATKNKRKQSIFDKHGVEVQGSYSAYRLKEINKALETGEASDKLREKLEKKGDYEILSMIDNVREQKQNVNKQIVTAKEVVINAGDGKNSANMARGGMLHGPSHSQGGMPILGSNIEVEGGEYVVNKNSAKKFKNTLNAINSMGNGGIITPRKMAGGGSIVVNQGGIGASSSFGPEKVSVDPININLSGTIKLEGANGQKADITKELLNNPQLISEITKLITKQMNINQHGANVVNRPGA